MNNFIKNRMRYSLFIIISSIIIITSYYVSEAKAKEEDDSKRVLFISSYSLSWDTIPLQIEGIQSALGDTVTLEYEFMNTKLIDDKKNITLFYKTLKHHLSRVQPYDVIIVGDDAALQFALDNQEELFTDTPIVFEGINDIERAEEAAKKKNITGVVEKMSYRDNIDFALTLYPKATKVAAILDDTVTGIGDKKQFFSEKEHYPNLTFEEINSSKLTKEQLCKKIEDLKEDTILFYLILSEDINENIYTNKEGIELAVSHANIPIFRAVQVGVGDGILGGYFISHKESGAIAGRMVAQILEGKNPDEIDIELDSPNFYFFDYEVMQKFGIDKRFIPKDAILIHYEEGFWKRNQLLIIIFLICIIILALFIVLLVLDNSKKKKRANMLEKTGQELEFLLLHDNLTLLSNRKKFLKDLQHYIDNKTICTVVLFDIDNFKKINDTYGHSGGDIVLKTIGKRLIQQEDELFHVYRFAGDEFTAIIASEKQSLIQHYIRLIQKAFETSIIIEDKTCQITSSIGTANYPKDTASLTELVKLADTAMYHIKSTGKNSYTSYNNIRKKTEEK